MKFLISMTLLTVFYLIPFNLSLAAEFRDTKFIVKTNVPGVTIAGTLKDISGELSSLDIPIKSLSTGIELRDKHMRDKIFSHHDITFKGELICSEKCSLKGEMSLSGVTKKVNISVSKKNERTFLINHKILLSDFEITPPKFMAVGVKNEVLITSRLLL